MQAYKLSPKSSYRVVQITDCHLLAEPEASYQGCQPAAHLAAIVKQLCLQVPDAVIFTGDLTQDHTAASYQLLHQLCLPLSCPVFLVPGNHDDVHELAQLSKQRPFQPADTVLLGAWQFFLLNTKSKTPAGEFPPERSSALSRALQRSTADFHWLFCHHHPLPLQCFIDKHGLAESQCFWQLLQQDSRIKGLAHGHAHLAYQRDEHGIHIVGCPASSVQFKVTPDWQTYNDGPQWCEWLFATNGQVSWQFKRL